MTENDAPARLRLPDRALPERAGGGAVSLRQGRHGTVIVLLGSSLEVVDAEFVRTLAERREALHAWDGRVLLLIADVDAPVAGALDDLRLSLPVLLDVESAVASAADVRPPALVITDQYGEAYLRESITADRPWPTVDSIEQWLRYLSIRCAG